MSALRAGIEQAGIAYPVTWEEMGASSKDLWEERQVHSLIKQEQALDVWLRFENEEDEDADHEANTFFNEDGTYRVEWSNTSVGQVTKRDFPTYAEATKWLEEGGYTDFTS